MKTHCAFEEEIASEFPSRWLGLAVAARQQLGFL
jgi:hypothetical protein